MGSSRSTNTAARREASLSSGSSSERGPAAHLRTRPQNHHFGGFLVAQSLGAQTKHSNSRGLNNPQYRRDSRSAGTRLGSGRASPARGRFQTNFLALVEAFRESRADPNPGTARPWGRSNLLAGIARDEGSAGTLLHRVLGRLAIPRQHHPYRNSPGRSHDRAGQSLPGRYRAPVRPFGRRLNLVTGFILIRQGQDGYITLVITGLLSDSAHICYLIEKARRILGLA